MFDVPRFALGFSAFDGKDHLNSETENVLCLKPHIRFPMCHKTHAFDHVFYLVASEASGLHGLRVMSAAVEFELVAVRAISRL